MATVSPVSGLRISCAVQIDKPKGVWAMIHMYYHGGSDNHGCEAIVRSTCKIIDQPMVLHTTGIESDRTYGLESLVSLEEDVYDPPYGRKLQRLAAAKPLMPPLPVLWQIRSTRWHLS